jgi:hypothetical protein
MKRSNLSTIKSVAVLPEKDSPRRAESQATTSFLGFKHYRERGKENTDLLCGIYSRL